MIKNIGIIFSGLLILLLLSNIHYNEGIQVLGQNNTLTTSNNNSETAVSPAISDPTATIPAPSSTTSKLTGGVNINLPDEGDLVPLNSNKSLVIYGVSKDTATSDCDVTLIVNNVKPYQNVQPTGIQGNNDYSSWKYTLASNYTSINEGNNKITSKIYCPAGIEGGGSSNSSTIGSGVPIGSQSASQAYYSVNVTGSNFTQAQLANYEMMLAAASNATNGGGNSTLAPSNSTVQPVALAQQFNQDTGSGPVCCATASGTIPGQTTGTTSPTAAAALTDDTPEVTTTDEDEAEEDSNSNDEAEEDSNSNDEAEEDSNSNDEEDNDNDNDNDNDSGSDIMDDVEDTLRDSGIDIDF